MEEYLDDGYIQDDAKQNNFNVGKNNLKQNNINQISNQILDKNPEIEEKILLPSELDALIAKVDKNDPKLLEVMGKLEGLRRRKDKG